MWFFRDGVLLGVDEVVYEGEKKENMLQFAFKSDVLWIQNVCALTSKLHRDAGYSAPSVWSAWQGQLLVTMTSYIPSTV